MARGRPRKQAASDPLKTTVRLTMKNSSRWLITLLAISGTAWLAGCATNNTSTANVSRAPFGKTKEGVAVDLYTLRNSKGAEAKCCGS